MIAYKHRQNLKTASRRREKSKPEFLEMDQNNE